MKLSDLPLDKVFLINLEHNRERLNQAENHLRKWQLPHERFDAVYAKQLNIRHDDSRFTQGMVGCFLSHFFIFQQAVREGWDCFLVLEDDFEPVPGFDYLFENAWKQVPEDWQFLWLGWQLPTNKTAARITRHNDYWMTTTALWGTQAYVVRGKEAIRTIYEDIKIMHDQIDLQLIGRSLHQIKHYCIYPSAVSQTGAGTDVQNIKPSFQYLDAF
jgi:GR25 family glycosyltransferase involved in LPS biosynthesis